MSPRYSTGESRAKGSSPPLEFDVRPVCSHQPSQDDPLLDRSSGSVGLAADAHQSVPRALRGSEPCPAGGHASMVHEVGEPAPPRATTGVTTESSPTPRAGGGREGVASIGQAKVPAGHSMQEERG
jgi:hypothetical protein